TKKTESKKPKARIRDFDVTDRTKNCLFLTSAKNKGRFVLAGFACFCAAVHRNRRIQRIKRANDDTQKRTCCKTKQRYNLKNRLSRGKGKKNNNSARRPACACSATAPAWGLRGGDCGCAE
ncbi:hypothetical protein, partial [uncultured Alistipes sp.]|uniref:hypothetical protein n=1 Tax=uncultured Alistipes sp. TaxID=538949 RepID=UPI002647195D